MAHELTGPQKGSPPTLEWTAVDRLSVDPAYQRATDGVQSRRIILGMIKCWDWSLCQPLVVSRRSDGSLFILDGQHRHAGALERGDIAHLPCVILPGLAHDGEAEAFVALNTKRQRLSQTDLFNGMLAAGDLDAVEIAAVIEATGWKVARGKAATSYGPGHLTCAPALVKLAKQNGMIPVRNALTALREAYPDTSFNNAATLLKALVSIYRDGDLDGEDPDTFIEALGSVEPQDWDDAGRDYRRDYPMLSRIEGLSAAMMAAYRDFAAERLAA